MIRENSRTIKSHEGTFSLNIGNNDNAYEPVPGTGTGRSNYRNLALRDVVILMVSGTSRSDATDIILLR